MANCGCKKCKNKRRIASNIVTNMPSGCFDVCTTPVCGSPDTLGLLAPLIYDEIGINLCTTFDLGTDIATTYPTATSATASVVSITVTYGEDGVSIDSIPGRPNCYAVTLSNLTVVFAVNVYDDACRLLGTVFPTAVYLPPSTAATYNEDTNPESVTLEIFAPYGVSYDTTTAASILNLITFAEGTNTVKQGLNLYAIAKLIDFNIADSSATVGLSVVLQSLYFAGYRVASLGKINTPKGSIIPSEDSDCIKFVAGELLNLEIKPLDLGRPACEENLKEDCTTGCQSCVSAVPCNDMENT